jgi:protein-disulfide isomerase-like protein with CxxC motif
MLGSYDGDLPCVGTQMPQTLHYILDPLCAWCYGAGVALAGVVDSGHGRRLLLHSSSLFSNPQAA